MDGRYVLVLLFGVFLVLYAVVNTPVAEHYFPPGAVEGNGIFPSPEPVPGPAVRPALGVESAGDFLVPTVSVAVATLGAFRFLRR